jgi:mRNA interferase MazF
MGRDAARRTRRRRDLVRNIALRRGDLWSAELDPVPGHEQGRRRPCAIVSADVFNRGRHGLVVICPLTRTEYHSPLHIEVAEGEGGLQARSFVLCEQVRTISSERLVLRVGSLRAESLARIDEGLRVLLSL